MAAKKLPVALVVTRSLDGNASSGRERTLQQIRLALDADFELTVIRVHNVFETRRPSDLVGASAAWVRSVAQGKPLPLQTVLYAGSHEIDRVVETLRGGKFAAIYIDSVRSQVLLRRLLAALPQARVIVDFDDLMSRRMQEYASMKLVPSLGFLAQLIPKPLRWSIQGPLAQMVVRYETAALHRSEKQIADVADAIVLVSAAERDLFRDQLSPALRERIHAVPPPAASAPQPHVPGPYRFVFIGSDKLVQNRLSIDFLLELWQRLSPATELHIFGRQERPNQPIKNVIWRGFVEDVSETYTPGSILLLPAIMPGGIKTKVIEAWSYGCPVLGNYLAFEGLNLPDYPLLRPQEEWASYVLDPAAHAEEWVAGAHAGHVVLSTTLSRDHFRAIWRDLMVSRTIQPTSATATV
jgi:glycosyltransferase involved in cell wall biosynthesis